MTVCRLGACLMLMALAACEKPVDTPVPVQPTPGTTCALDGMLLQDYPGPKAQVYYGNGRTEFFCDTVEMFSIYLSSKPPETIGALFTQDMGKAEWNKPEGHWIDARSAYYVAGSALRGAMGPTLVPFALHSDAKHFAARHGGKVLRFDEVTPDMVDLSGGAQQDETM